MRFLLLGLIAALVAGADATVSAQAHNVATNQTNLESDLRARLGDHYLVKRCILHDKDVWLTLELKPNTWRNPNDTRALIDSVVAVVKRHVPLSVNSNIPFQVHVDEPESGFRIATIISSDLKVKADYSYPEKREIQRKEARAKQPQAYKTQRKSATPQYEIVAVNPNGHKIFIVTKVTSKNGLLTIVENYKARYEVPEHTWMINFFSNKQKALRVKKEWLIPRKDDPDYDLWVFNENVDHSGIAQWTSWDGLTFDKW